jgi:hypothetical protein
MHCRPEHFKTIRQETEIFTSLAHTSQKSGLGFETRKVENRFTIEETCISVLKIVGPSFCVSSFHFEYFPGSFHNCYLYVNVLF